MDLDLLESILLPFFSLVRAPLCAAAGGAHRQEIWIVSHTNFGPTVARQCGDVRREKKRWCEDDDDDERCEILLIYPPWCCDTIPYHTVNKPSWTQSNLIRLALQLAASLRGVKKDLQSIPDRWASQSSPTRINHHWRKRGTVLTKKIYEHTRHNNMSLRFVSRNFFQRASNTFNYPSFNPAPLAIRSFASKKVWVRVSCLYGINHIMMSPHQISTHHSAF